MGTGLGPVLCCVGMSRGCVEVQGVGADVLVLQETLWISSNLKKPQQ